MWSVVKNYLENNINLGLHLAYPFRLLNLDLETFRFNLLTILFS